MVVKNGLSNWGCTRFRRTGHRRPARRISDETYQRVKASRLKHSVRTD